VGKKERAIYLLQLEHFSTNKMLIKRKNVTRKVDARGKLGFGVEKWEILSFFLLTLKSTKNAQN
jgi:hypothetical protein